MKTLTGIADDAFDLDTAPALASVMRAFGDPNRLFILALLGDRPEMTVLDLTWRMTLSQPTVSHHLKILKAAGLVTSTKRGVWVWYALDRRGLRAAADAIRPGRAR